ncbi:MAG TPA: DNA recombination protein RmuC [Bacteroidales bacterium]|nr:DNA recombination protein RmuC [Bacteroidales bacterium]
MEILITVFVLIAGFLLAYFFLTSRYRSKHNELEASLQAIEKERIGQLAEKESKIAVLEDRLLSLNTEKDKLTTESGALREELSEKNSAMARLQAMHEQMQEKLENQKKELAELQQKFALEFENLANRLFKQHSQEFMQSSGKNLNELINPLKERLQTFEKKVQDVYEVEMRDKISLRQEVKNLFELNRKLSEDAENLTKALKGDLKKQGNWGEIVLERVLERSGLTKGNEYETQASIRGVDGQLLRPDVVIRLPENKHLIIDSKVSLVAYEKFISSEDEQEKTLQLRRHVESIRAHIKNLSEKSYQAAGGFDTPDFVLLFLPVEPAFGIALQHDPELFSYAWERKIVIVSPTTLLATLKTVSSIWKQEKQTQNALEIARQGGGLYDKFVNFVEDLQKLGNQLNTVQKTYDDAHKKLFTGSGNLVGRAEKLRKLGVKTSKVLPAQYLLTENEEDERLSETPQD